MRLIDRNAPLKDKVDIFLTARGYSIGKACVRIGETNSLLWTIS